MSELTTHSSFRKGYYGTGPGTFAPDGSAVDHYRRLRVGDELDIVEGAIPPGSSVLELGCGVGRISRPLAERGFLVTAVDESQEMLQHVIGARTVRCRIETLDLRDDFDVVLLASFLINMAADTERCIALLRACRRHVKADGCVVIQREGDHRHERSVESQSAQGEIFRIRSSKTTDEGVLLVQAEYVYPDVTWTQTFLSRPLSKDALKELLREADLKVDSYLTKDETWLRARPA